jgi:hypothetical protein
VTAKQLLVAHLREHHPRVQTAGRPWRQLSTAHARDHDLRYDFLDHDHADTGRGPDENPLGLRTGRDAVMRPR